MRAIKIKKEKEFLKEYNQLVNQKTNDFTFNDKSLQWKNPNDYIVKFSLYQDTPNSITSTETLLNINF